jgi:D-alanyl-D-alanine endopeptidase (penicillin-binding protein 7)
MNGVAWGTVMQYARVQGWMSLWRRGCVLAAAVLLSLSVLAPATAAPAKKGAQAAETRKANKGAAAAPSKSARAAAKPGARKAAGPSRAAAKGKAGHNSKLAANKTPPRAASKAAASKRQQARSGRDQRGKAVAQGTSRAQARINRVAASENRLALRPARRSYGQMAGLHAVDDPLDLSSSVALVVDQDTHEVLFSKNDHAVLPIASLTKLMTGLIISDAGLPLDELITITEEDVDTEKGSSSRLSVGATLSRGELLHLALMSSENRAAHALGRTYPGGLQRFVSLMNARAIMLGMKDTRYVEPTGLSSGNRSSAPDLAMLVHAASQDPLLRQLSTSHGYEVALGNRVLQYNNTNRLVHSPEWRIGLQKTGYISEAGQCLAMQAQVAGRKLIMVFLDSSGKQSRLADAERVRRWVEERRPLTTAEDSPRAG